MAMENLVLIADFTAKTCIFSGLPIATLDYRRVIKIQSNIHITYITHIYVFKFRSGLHCCRSRIYARDPPVGWLVCAGLAFESLGFGLPFLLHCSLLRSGHLLLPFGLPVWCVLLCLDFVSV